MDWFPTYFVIYIFIQIVPPKCCCTYEKKAFKIYWLSKPTTESQTHTFQKNLCYLAEWKPFKNDEECFLSNL